MADKTSMFASLEGLPTTMGSGATFKNMKPISKGVNLPATKEDREFKKKYDEEAMNITTDGFTIYVSLSSHELDKGFYTSVMKMDEQTPAQTFFKFTIGETPSYSFYFGESAESYPLTLSGVKVRGIQIDRKKDVVKILFTEDVEEMIIKKKKLEWKYASGDNGYFFQRTSGSRALLMGVAPYNEVNTRKFGEEVAKDLTMMLKSMIPEGNGVYFWDADTATTHFSPQSFTFDSEIDKEFLLPAKVDYDNLQTIDMKKSYISFSVAVENKAKRTNNYTGRHSGDSSYIVNLQFPGDEELLAPMGVGEDGTTVACGADSPAGRVLKSITPVEKNGVVEQVRLDFRDGSNYIFPDSETGLFTATDKEFPEQMLEGKVMNLILAVGSPKENHAKEVATRLEQDVDIQKTIMDDGKPITQAIAWTTNNPSAMKVLVPNPDGKGSKLITIPLTREA